MSIIKAYKHAGVPVVVVYIMARPYALAWEKDSANALLIAYRPGNGAGGGVASVLFGEFTPKGRLPWQLPRSLAQIGSSSPQNMLEQWNLPYDIGATDAERLRIRNLISQGLPCNTIFGDSLWGDPLYQYGAGMQVFK
jgi:beta-glucosidase